MVLAVVDDLLFASKIRSTAARLGREVVFARSSDAAIEQGRGRTPDVILVDLDSRRLDALATIAATRADASLSAVPIVGFVSHVRVDLVEAARQAGADRVLSRSAFVAHLSEILAAPR
jgi:CheY-like chemotaxis protein